MKKIAYTFIIGTLLWANIATAIPADAANRQGPQNTVQQSDSQVVKDRERSRKGWLNIAAETMGMESKAMWQELAKGKSIAEVAAAMNIDSQTVVDAIVTAETETISKQLAELQDRATKFVMETPTNTTSDGDHGNEDPSDGNHGDDGENPEDGAPSEDSPPNEDGTDNPNNNNGTLVCDDVSIDIVDEAIIISGLSSYSSRSLKVINRSDDSISYQCTDECLDPEKLSLAEGSYSIELKASDDNRQCAVSWSFSGGGSGIELPRPDFNFDFDFDFDDNFDLGPKFDFDDEFDLGFDLDSSFDFSNGVDFDFDFNDGDGVNYIHIGITKTEGITLGNNISWTVPGWGYHTPDDYHNNRGWLRKSAKAIGVNTAELASAWRQGKTIASVAVANEVTPQTVIDALVADAKEMAEVKTQMLPKAAKNFVQHSFTRPSSPDDDGGSDDGDDDGGSNDGSGSDDPADAWAEDEKWFENEDDSSDSPEVPSDSDFVAVDWYQVVAEQLNITTDELIAKIEQDRSIADVASALNINSQTLIDAIIVAERTALDKAVADGLLDQEEADEWLAEVKEHVADFINAKEEEIFEDDLIDATLLDDVDWLSAILASTGLDKEKLWSEILNGRSLGDILKDANIDRQVVVDAILESEREVLARIVRLGLMEQADADKWLDAIEKIANDFLDDKLVESAPATEEPAQGEDAATVVSQAATKSLSLRKDMAAKSLAASGSAQVQDFGIFLPFSVQ